MDERTIVGREAQPGAAWPVNTRGVDAPDGWSSREADGFAVGGPGGVSAGRPRPGSALRSAAASQVGRQLVQLLTLAVLARLVPPADFGLVGMAALVVALLALFRDLGTASALIQRSVTTSRLVSTILWLNVMIGLAIAGVVWIAASPVAAFFGEPRVEPLLRVLALAPLITSVGQVHQVLLERDLQFGRLLRVEIASVIVGGSVGVGLALTGAGAWSLVGQTLAQVTASTVGLWLASRFRPAFVFELVDVRSVARFSAGITGAMLFNYLARNADYVIIGRALGAEQLGFYTLAYRMMLYPLQHVTNVASRVMYPVYARLTDRDDDLRRLYLTTAGGIAMVTMPMAMGTMAVSEPLIIALLGPAWAPAVPVLAILSPVAVIHSVATTTGSIYMAKGRSDALFMWGAFSAVITVVAFLIGLRWGIVGVATGYLAASAVLAYPQFAIPLRYIGLRVRDVWRAVASPVVIGMVMAVVVSLVTQVVIASADPLAKLAAGVLVGAGLYGSALWMFERDRVRDALAVLRTGARA